MIEFVEEKPNLSQEERELMESNIHYVEHTGSISVKAPDGTLMSSKWGVSCDVPDGMDRDKVEHFCRIQVKRRLQYDYANMLKGKI